MRCNDNYPINIVIADDHDVYRDGLLMLLSRDTRICVLGQADNGKELVKISARMRPDVIITDLRMPLMNGVDAIRELAFLGISARIIALSMFDDENLVIDALEAGAYGYIIKNAHRGEIMEAIRTVYAGKPYYCRSTSAQFARKISQSGFDPYGMKSSASFNEKEKQIITLVCDQRSSKEIADTMAMNYRTVERIRAAILEKMNVKSAAGVAIYAVKNQLYDPRK